MKLKGENITNLLLSVTFVTLAYIGFTFYHTSVTSTLDDDLTLQIQPISASFNKTAIEHLIGRTSVPPTYELAGEAEVTEEAASAAGSLQPVEDTSAEETEESAL